MKTLKIAFITLFSLQLLLGCKRNEIDLYSGNEGLYFVSQYSGLTTTDKDKWPYLAGFDIEFMHCDNPEEETRTMTVRTLGALKDYDRSFTVTSNREITTASTDNFQFEESHVIKAGEREVTFDIKLINTPNLKTEQRVLCLQLVENEHFKIAFPTWYSTSTDNYQYNGGQQHIKLSSRYVKPPFWYGLSDPKTNNQEKGKWGEFSEKKMNLMLELSGMKYKDFLLAETMPIKLVNDIKLLLSTHLTKRMTDGDPILELDGRAMWAEGCKWKSFVGVPYVKE